jgi:hypothetical protein
MKRHLLTLVLSGLVGSLVLAGNAEACHKKTCTCAPAPCAVAVCAPAPCPAPAPVCAPTCAPKKCGLFAHMQGMKLGCHKRAVCAAPVAPVCAAPVAPCPTVAYYSAPVYYSAPAVYSSPQASAQR